MSLNDNFIGGPFLLYHLGMRVVNVLLDNEINMSVVLDWSYVMTIRVEVVANFQSDLGWKYCL